MSGKLTNQPRALPLIFQVWVATITAQFAVVVGSLQPKAHGQQKGTPVPRADRG